ncbi:MAG: hypothetical protein WED10_00015 [Brumimicrobium sp.]
MKLFEKYSFKQKKLFVLVLFVLLGAVAYKRSFKVTLDQLQLNGELEHDKERAQNSLQTLKQKTVQLNQINAIIGKENVQNETVQHTFLNFLQLTDAKLKVDHIEGVYQYKHPDFIINTNKITLNGNYLETTSFIHQFESEFDLGRLVSLKLSKNMNRSSRNKELLTTMYFQNFSE